jgi:hypothetical protein
MSEDFAEGAGPPPLMTTEEVVSLARAAISSSREQSRRGDDASSSGITVDLTHRNIARLPDEVIDIIKDEIERLVNALSQLSQPVPVSCMGKRVDFLLFVHPLFLFLSRSLDSYEANSSYTHQSTHQPTVHPLTFTMLGLLYLITAWPPFLRGLQSANA